MADQFDNFTERARHVLMVAREEAVRFSHNYIGTEHILLGLVREQDGVAAKVLANLGVELNKVRSGTEFIIGRGDRQVLYEIGLTPRAKKVIELAVDETRRMHHTWIGTQHILLGLIRENEGIAAGILESLGVNLERARAETTRVLSLNPKNPPGAQMPEANAPGSEIETSGIRHDADMIAAGLPILIEGVSRMSAEGLMELQPLAEALFEAVKARWTELQVESVED